jgi:hypothetical protein
LDSPYFFDNTIYWSEGDEKAHFEWMNSIPFVRKVHGRGSRLFIEIDPDRANHLSVLELEAVYRRYEGDLGQLTSLKERFCAPNK